ncbi:PREDICTED: proteolipid protein 2 [Corvus brachyrhynchos]|uniref:proteolipid protein 2 n=1 Tax=Corvus brachyrhynchos TaxID=85066 RepID=UPI0008163FD5|nr:PREDICTED: proteolipid protein 2 [Corvus brachyrhynchos]
MPNGVYATVWGASVGTWGLWGGFRGCPPTPYGSYMALYPQILCLLTLICFGASRSGYAGLAAVELVFAALVLLAWGCRLPPPLGVLGLDGESGGTGGVWGGATGGVWVSLTPSTHQVFGILAGILLGYDAYITLPTRQGHTAAPTESPDGA